MREVHRVNDERDSYDVDLHLEASDPNITRALRYAIFRHDKFKMQKVKLQRKSVIDLGCRAVDDRFGEFINIILIVDNDALRFLTLNLL